MGFLKYNKSSAQSEKAETDMGDILELKNKGPVILEWTAVGDFGIKFAVQVVQWVEIAKDGTVVKENSPSLQIVWNVIKGGRSGSFIDHSGEKWASWTGKFKGLPYQETLNVISGLMASAEKRKSYVALKTRWENLYGKVKQPTVKHSNNPAEDYEDMLLRNMGITATEKPAEKPAEVAVTPKVPDLLVNTVVRRGRGGK